MNYEDFLHSPIAFAPLPRPLPPPEVPSLHLLSEPQDFLDSAITAYKPSRPCATAPPPLPPNLQPPPPGARPTSVLNCSSWGHCLCQICCNSGRLHHRSSRSSPSHFACGVAARVTSHIRRILCSLWATAIYRHIQALKNWKSAGKKLSSLKLYEQKLHSARWAARCVGTAYILSTFLALCSLTWATVVLLGAYVSNLRFVDYAMVTSLLLLEAIRLASAAFFTVLLTHGLARLSQDPENIIHGRDDHYHRTLIARILSSILQAILILPSFMCPIIRFPILQYHGVQNLQISLLIFYLLVIANALVSSVTLILSSVSFIHLRDRNDQSTLRYYDELVQRSITFGVIRADEFGFFQFAYRMLGSEYARIVQPEAVVKNHRKLIEYLYNHRLGQDFLAIFMNEDDAFVQQAAVNMPGFWADPNKQVGLKDVKLTARVLSKLADKVGAGQVGWAACNSFGAVARKYPDVLARTRMSCGMPLLERLAELIDGTSSSELTYVRTLVLFYHYSCKEGMTVPCMQQEKELVRKLKQLLKDVKVHRLRIHAAYLLHLMGHLYDECHDAVAAIRPTEDTYWFEIELDLLKFIRRQCGMDELPADLNLPENFLRKDGNESVNGDKNLSFHVNSYATAYIFQGWNILQEGGNVNQL